MNKIRRFCSAAYQIGLYYLLFLPAIIIYKRKHYWLVSERGDDARDNGFWMFKYIREEHPEINIVYVIDPKSKDAPKVSALGKTLKKGCLKHWLVFIAADIRMSTHLFLFAPAPYAGQWIKKHRPMQSINIDLQHGITHNRFPSTYKEINGCDLFVCGAKPEFEWVVQEFQWSPETAVYTGFARFDGLHNYKTKKQILIMPSWRTELRDSSEAAFLESSYYRHWNELLTSPKLAELIDKYDINIKFYIHYSLQRFSHLFTGITSRIMCVSFSQADVQQLLKESKLLITDYSSVFFDFAYMHKPLIYYQFDYDDFYSRHYKPGFFSHQKDGFGPVVSNKDQLLDEIDRYVQNRFTLDSKYEPRIKHFFPLDDANNCQRIYEAIIKTHGKN